MIIPSTVKTIGKWAFQGCKNLTSATIPASLIEKIKGKQIFKGCDNLKEVNVIDANGKITKDNNWYWKEEMSQETKEYLAKAKEERERLENQKMENSYDFPWPDKEGEFKTQLFESYEEALIEWYNPRIVVLVRKRDNQYYFEYPDGWSPSFKTYSDVLAAIWFYYVWGYKRTRGIYGSSSW